MALLVFLEIVASYLATQKPAEFSAYGLNYLGAIYLFDLLILMLIARLAKAESVDTGRLLLAYLASVPLITITFDLFTLPDQFFYNHLLGSSVVLILLFAWHLFIVIRLLRVILMLAFGKAFYLATLSMYVTYSIDALTPPGDQWCWLTISIPWIAIPWQTAIIWQIV
ncbi:MAG: hypothetical protein ABW157_13500 [Candidatus Thiodiazotropha sp. LLP2]